MRSFSFFFYSFYARDHVLLLSFLCLLFSLNRNKRVQKRKKQTNTSEMLVMCTRCVCICVCVRRRMGWNLSLHLDFVCERARMCTHYKRQQHQHQHHESAKQNVCKYTSIDITYKLNVTVSCCCCVFGVDRAMFSTIERFVTTHVIHSYPRTHHNVCNKYFSSSAKAL